MGEYDNIQIPFQIIHDAFTSIFWIPILQFRESNPVYYRIWIYLIILLGCIYLYSYWNRLQRHLDRINSSRKIKGGSMAYWDTGRFDVEEVYLNVKPTEKQEEAIEKLCLIADFRRATYHDSDSSFTFTKFDEYDVVVNFFKKLLHIVPDFEADVEISDSKEDNEYWILKIRNGEIEECFGTVFWGSEEEKDKIFKVLESRVSVQDPAVLYDITEQIVNAIKGEYDHLDEEETTEAEEETETEDEDNNTEE